MIQLDVGADCELLQQIVTADCYCYWERRERRERRTEIDR